MTKDEIKKALERCVNGVSCESCSYYKGLSKPCVDGVVNDALDLITEQEKEIDLLQMQMKDVINHADTFLAEANKFEAENKKLKAENKMRLINLHTALDDIKQVQIDTINTIVKYCENQKHWNELKDCKLFGGKSDDLRNFLNGIFKEVQNEN